jgi:cellulose synthase/poly-beta-1,6-N-acetylglucosamine synthase-like glycosyltransferase
VVPIAHSAPARPSWARAFAPRAGPGAAVAFSLLGALSASPLALGAIPIGILAGYLLYRAVRLFRSWSLGASRSVGATPMEAPRVPPVGPATPPPTATGGAPRPAHVSAPTAQATVWTPKDGEVTLPGDWQPRQIAAVPPPAQGFGRTLLLAFFVVALIVLAANRYLFYALDKIVVYVGTALYWPIQWPGLVHNPALARTLPDYVFAVYIAFMLAFCLTSGLFTDSRFRPAQRRGAVAIFLAYLISELFLDSIGFIFPGRLAGSAFLLLRGLIGGTFFAMLLFDALALPAPVEVKPHLPRDPWATGTFLLSALASIGLGLLTLYLFNRLFGLGRDLLPFALLLLLPLAALTIWGVLGRILYSLQLRARPLPSVLDYHPPVSVVIPAFNEHGNIASAVASADEAAFLYPGLTEIIVANDGSADDTSEEARGAVRRLRHARGSVIDLPHGGKSNALNGALRLARGEVIVRIDADSRISTTRGFGGMVPHLADPEVGGVQGLILPLQPETWTGKLRLMEVAWNHLFLRRAQMATRTTQVVDGAFCAFRRADLLAVGGWVPWNGEDTEITLRLQRQGYRMRFEMSAAAFEDVPGSYATLRKQRIRWNRGGIFAHRRHLGALFGDAFEFGGLAILMWFTLFARGGLRGLVWAYAALLTILLGLPTILTVALITAILLIPRSIVIGFYLVRFGKWRYLPYLATWPVTGSMKQFFSLEAFGTMLPGAAAEFSE